MQWDWSARRTSQSKQTTTITATGANDGAPQQSGHQWPARQTNNNDNNDNRSTEEDDSTTLMAHDGGASMRQCWGPPAETRRAGASNNGHRPPGVVHRCGLLGADGTGPGEGRAGQDEMGLKWAPAPMGNVPGRHTADETWLAHSVCVCACVCVG